MADIDLKTETPDTSLPTTGFLFGADSQAAASPSVFTVQSVATTLLGSTTLSGATITADAPVLNMSQTWNNGAVTFTGLKFNATDTASAAASLLMDLQVGGASRFSVRKTGAVFIPSTLAYTSSNWTGINGSNNTTTDNGIAVRQNNFFMGSLCIVAWGNTTDPINGQDTFLTRRGAANLRLGAADAATALAQTLSVQSVVAGTSNTAGANLTITGSQGTGTGAGGSIIFQVAPAGTTGTAQNALETFGEITSARELNLYRTTDVTTNFERFRLEWVGTEFRLGTEASGTGAIRSFGLYVGNTRYQIIGSNFNQFDQPIYINTTGIATGAGSGGFKIGTATTQGLGFWNATPSAQPAAVADATDAATVITQLNALLSRMRTIGLIAT